MPRGAKKQKGNSIVNKKNAEAEAPAGPSEATPATAAAPAGVAATVAPAALPLELQLLSSVLQFSDMRQDQASICRLLVTSKAAAAVVAEDCRGQLHINLSPKGYDRAAEQRCAAQASWLKRNGLLVRELTATSAYGSWDPSLQHLKTTLGTLLPTVASSMPLLTKLTGCLYVSSFKTAAALNQLLNSLGALTSLQHLNLHLMRADAGLLGGPKLLMAGLKQCLPNLNHLDLYFEGSGPGFMHMSSVGLESLPASLQCLGLTVKLGLHDSNHEEFVVEAGLGELWAMTGGKGFDQTFMLDAPYPSTPQPPMKLGHLTALKVLKPYDGPTRELSELAIREGDVLPPNLTELVLDADFRSLDGALTGVLARPTVGPLMPLKNLQVLVVYNSKASAAQLQQMAAALTPPTGSLKEVSLGYTSWKAATGAAAAWPHLPLVNLSIYERHDYSDCGEFKGEFGEDFDEFGSGSDDEQDFAPEHVAELLFTPMSQLTALTSLVCSVPSAKPSAQLLANAVPGLSRLQTLILTFDSRHEFPHHFESVEEVHSVAALAGAIAALPNLSDLQPGFPLPGVAAAIADGACAKQLTPLTSLKLKGLSDADVALLQASPAGAALSVQGGF